MHKRDVGIPEEREEAKKKAVPIFEHPEGRFYRLEGLDAIDPDLAARARAFVARRLPKPSLSTDLWCRHGRDDARIDGNGNVVCVACSPLLPGEKGKVVEIW